jgi:hypothetical protein
MPNARIGEQKRKQVIKLWLLGTTRAEIHRITGISSGALSNIIADYKKRLDGYDPEALKDFVKELEEHKILPSQCAIGYKIIQEINRMGGDEEKIEDFLSLILKECIDKKVPPDALALSARASIDFSAKEGIPISEIPGQVEERKTELARLKAERERLQRLRKTRYLRTTSLPKSLSSILLTTKRH